MEGNIICDSIYDASKSMTENVNEYKHRVEDFKDYIEMWIHEVMIKKINLAKVCKNVIMKNKTTKTCRRQ